MLAGPWPSVAGARVEHESERRPWGRGPRCVANQTWVATCGRALSAGEGHPAFTRTERVGRLSPQPAAGATCGLLCGRVSLRGGRGFNVSSGRGPRCTGHRPRLPDACGASSRQSRARLARGEGGAHMSARPQKVGMAFLVLHFDTNNNAYICMLQRNPYVAEGLWGPAWDHVRGTSRQIACNLAVGTASKVDCKTLCSPHLL